MNIGRDNVEQEENIEECDLDDDEVIVEVTFRGAVLRTVWRQ